MNDIYPKVDVYFFRGVINRFPGWGNFDRVTIEQNAGKLLMLDLDFGKNCSRKCSCCFRQSPGFKHSDMSELSYDKICSVILEAKELGLCEVKILGAGEPFESKKFLGFLRFLHEQDIVTSVFTKGQVIADDRLAELFNNEYGIHTGSSLAQELYRLNVSLIVGFNMIGETEQDEWVRVPGHTLLRNRAIEILAEVGFNKTNPTRLAIGSSPTTTANISEMVEVYKWARHRNIYTVICPTMASVYHQRWQEDLPDEDSLVDLFTQIYRINLEMGIQTLKDLKRDGISAYAGVAPCNQVACGMYLTLDGVVHGCPGDDATIHGDVRKKSLKEIWEASPNRRRAGIYNCGCPAKTGRSIPKNLFERVFTNLEKGK